MTLALEQVGWSIDIHVTDYSKHTYHSYVYRHAYHGDPHTVVGGRSAYRLAGVVDDHIERLESGLLYR